MEVVIVYNVYLEFEKFLKMIWLINYYCFVVVIMFIFFFVGKMFVLKCIIDGMNI